MHNTRSQTGQQRSHVMLSACRQKTFFFGWLVIVCLLSYKLDILKSLLHWKGIQKKLVITECLTYLNAASLFCVNMPQRLKSVSPNISLGDQGSVLLFKEFLKSLNKILWVLLLWTGLCHLQPLLQMEGLRALSVFMLLSVLSLSPTKASLCGASSLQLESR